MFYLYYINFISPPINWKNVDLSPVAVSLKNLLLLSTLFTLVLDADPLSNDPPAVVLNSVCTRMHQQPFLLRNPSDTGDVLRLVEDSEKKPGKGTAERSSCTEGTQCEIEGRDCSTEAENNRVIFHAGIATYAIILF